MSPPEPPPAAAPVASAAAARVGAALALGLVALGVVGVRDAAIAAGWIGGTPWVPAAADAVDGLTPSGWMPAAAVFAAVLGVALLGVAVAPRRRVAVPVTAASAVFLRRADVATIAATVARDVPGVLDARATASSRRLVVRCTVTTGDAGLRQRIEAAVATELAALHRVPAITVRARTAERA